MLQIWRKYCLKKFLYENWSKYAIGKPLEVETCFLLTYKDAFQTVKFIKCILILLEAFPPAF